MSTRERWIVYPLLFLTLGIVMRDKVWPQGHFQANEVTAARIHCDQLQVDQVASAGGIAVNTLQCGRELTAGKLRCDQLQVDQVMSARGLVVQGIQCGELLVAGPNGRATVIIATDPKKGGVIQTRSPTGAPLVLLQPTDSGGVVVASEFVKGRMASPEKPNTPTMPAPKQPAKDAEKSAAKTGK